MSTTPPLCQNPCETCAKEGLPILLARYAVMPNEANAPKLSGSLKPGTLDSAPLGASAHYGLRLLRTGYVYVFDEKRTRWDEYFVTTDGFLGKLPPRIKAFALTRKPATEFNCARNGVAPLAGIITIQNPKHAADIWIAFSDTEWTDAILDKHQDRTYRSLHMTKITISGGKIATQAHTAPIEQVEKHLPEFKLDARDAINHFSAWNPHRFNSRTGSSAPATAGLQDAAEWLLSTTGKVKQVKDWQPGLMTRPESRQHQFLEAMKNVRPQGGGAIVALLDPVGIATEIAALMEASKVTFMNQEKLAKPRFAASAIASLEASIREQTKLNELTAGDELAKRAEAGPAAYNPNAALYGVTGDYEEAERWRTHTPASLKRAADRAWKQYTHDRTSKPRFDYAGSQDWLKTYNDNLLKFDAERIAPLAKAHVVWMQNDCMVNHMSCNYDSANRESGVAYTATVVDLLRYTTDKQASYELYLQWLKTGEFAAQNLVMRAMVFNQTELIDKLKQADAAPLDGRAFPTDAVAGTVGAYMEKMPASTNAQMAALLAGLSGPTLKYWDDFNAGKVGSKAAAAMAAVSGKQIVRLPVVGNRGQFVQAYVRQLYMLDPTLKTNPNQLHESPRFPWRPVGLSQAAMAA